MTRRAIRASCAATRRAPQMGESAWAGPQSGPYVPPGACRVRSADRPSPCHTQSQTTLMGRGRLGPLLATVDLQLSPRPLLSLELRLARLGRCCRDLGCLQRRLRRRCVDLLRPLRLRSQHCHDVLAHLGKAAVYKVAPCYPRPPAGAARRSRAGRSTAPGPAARRVRRRTSAGPQNRPPGPAPPVRG